MRFFFKAYQVQDVVNASVVNQLRVVLRIHSHRKLLRLKKHSGLKGHTTSYNREQVDSIAQVP